MKLIIDAYNPGRTFDLDEFLRELRRVLLEAREGLEPALQE